MNVMSPGILFCTSCGALNDCGDVRLAICGQSYLKRESSVAKLRGHSTAFHRRAAFYHSLRRRPAQLFLVSSSLSSQQSFLPALLVSDPAMVKETYVQPCARVLYLLNLLGDLATASTTISWRSRPTPQKPTSRRHIAKSPWLL